jgi:hypothetical protein
MQERFEVARSANYVRGNAAVRVHVICREEHFYLDVPQEIRSLGPWSVISRGEMSELLAEHRHTLAREGYVVIEAHMLDFEKRLKAL